MTSSRSAMKKSAMKQSPESSNVVIEKPITMPAMMTSSAPPSTSTSVMRPTDEELDEFVTTLKTQVRTLPF